MVPLEGCVPVVLGQAGRELLADICIAEKGLPGLDWESDAVVGFCTPMLMLMLILLEFIEVAPVGLGLPVDMLPDVIMFIDDVPVGLVFAVDMLPVVMLDIAALVRMDPVGVPPLTTLPDIPPVIMELLDIVDEDTGAIVEVMSGLIAELDDVMGEED